MKIKRKAFIRELDLNPELMLELINNVVRERQCVIQKGDYLEVWSYVATRILTYEFENPLSRARLMEILKSGASFKVLCDHQAGHDYALCSSIAMTTRNKLGFKFQFAQAEFNEALARSLEKTYQLDHNSAVSFMEVEHVATQHLMDLVKDPLFNTIPDELFLKVYNDSYVQAITVNSCGHMEMEFQTMRQEGVFVNYNFKKDWIDNDSEYLIKISDLRSFIRSIRLPARESNMVFLSSILNHRACPEQFRVEVLRMVCNLPIVQKDLELIVRDYLVRFPIRPELAELVQILR